MVLPYLACGRFSSHAPNLASETIRVGIQGRARGSLRVVSVDYCLAMTKSLPFHSKCKFQMTIPNATLADVQSLHTGHAISGNEAVADPSSTVPTISCHYLCATAPATYERSH